MAIEQAARRRIARLVVLVAVAATYFTLSNRWPKDNVVHVVLGPAAPEVAGLHLRYASVPKYTKNAPVDEDWTREATFSFPDGSAPRIVTHEPRIADGDYAVEIEILKASHAIVKVRRPHVPLAGGTTSIDVSEAVAGVTGMK